MNRKTIIICIAAIAVLFAAVSAAVIYLYSDAGRNERNAEELLKDSRFKLFRAVPSDAVAVLRFSSLREASETLADSLSFAGDLIAGTGKSSFLFFLKDVGKNCSSLRSSPCIISLHYNGRLVPLLIADAGKISPGSADYDSCSASAEKYGLHFSLRDGAADSHMSGMSLLTVSSSDVLVESSARHCSEGISVLDSDGFAQAAAGTVGENLLLLSNRNSGKLVSGIMHRSKFKYADFLKRTGDWSAFSMEEADENSFSLRGAVSCDRVAADFMSVFSSLSPASSSVQNILPAGTVFSVSVHTDDPQAYVKAYDRFRDSSTGLSKVIAYRKELAKSAGISPESWMEQLQIKEVAFSVVPAGGAPEEVVLVRPGKEVPRLIFGASDSVSMKDYVPDVREFKYRDFVSSLFGKLFAVPDQSCFTYRDGWIVIGSMRAVKEFVSGDGITLGAHLAEIRKDNLFPRSSYLTVYFSALDAMPSADAVFSRDFKETLSASAAGCDYCMAVLSAGREKSSVGLTLKCLRGVAARKVEENRGGGAVEVPKGPFQVKNSATGRTNLFSQHENMYLSLKEENGKGLWTVAFKTPLCGAAGNVDYFSNGKLQILFASGSSLYLIDRLGRFVKPFPVDLGKEILLGPAIYDFNGTRKYNVMILHKDNTVRMYNLQGKVPSQWKDITAGETIIALPERIVIGDKSWWVVRTSLQTLIFDFYGGLPITVFEGDRMIRNDSEIKIVGDSSVEVTCRNGKKSVIKL